MADNLVSFACPHCGAKASVAAKFAGRQTPCPTCRKTLTIPNRDGTIANAEPEDVPPVQTTATAPPRATSGARKSQASPPPPIAPLVAIPVQRSPTIACPHCGQQVQLPMNQTGQALACPYCGGHFTMPNIAPQSVPIAQPSAGQGSPFAPASVSTTGRRPFTTANNSHSVLIAVLLNFCCIFGFGQIYNGQAIKGVVLILISMVCAVLTSGVSILVTFPVGLIDAGMIASRIKRGERVSDWQWF